MGALVQFILSERAILIASALSILVAVVWLCLVGNAQSRSDARAADAAVRARAEGGDAAQVGSAGAKPGQSGKSLWRNSRLGVGGASDTDGDAQGAARAAGSGPRVDAKPTTERVIATDHGPLMVTIEGDASLTRTIVTVHDVGNNHRSCFNPFFQAAAQVPAVAGSRIVHVTVPGQEDGAATLEAFPTLDNIAQRIVAGMGVLGVRRFMGVGVGAGVNILLRVSAQHQHMLSGLVSIGGSRKGATWQEKAYLLYVEGLLRTVGLNDVCRSAIINQHCSRTAFRRAVNRDLDACLRDMNPDNLRMFVAEYRRRNELTPEQLPAVAKEDTPVLAIAGTLSRGALPFVPVTPVETNALDLYRLTQFRLSTRIPVRSGVWAIVEAPLSLVEPISLFLSAIGFA